MSLLNFPPELYIGLFTKAVESVQVEPRFRLPAENCQLVLTEASAVTEWMVKPENEIHVGLFCENLLSRMRNCFEYTKKGHHLKTKCGAYIIKCTHQKAFSGFGL